MNASTILAFRAAAARARNKASASSPLDLSRVEVTEDDRAHFTFWAKMRDYSPARDASRRDW